MLLSQNELGFVNTTSMTFSAFKFLWSAFHSQQPMAVTGRPSLMDSKDLLGLILYWFNGKYSQKTLCQIFGCSPSIISRNLKRGLRILLISLLQFKECHVTWPTEDEMQQYSRLIQSRFPHIPNVFGFLDGLNLAIEEPGNINEQNAYYNGWLSGCYASNILVFSPTGTIIFAALNAPGSWHDAAIARPLYTVLAENTPLGFRLVADSAFPRSSEMALKIVGPLKDDALNRIVEGEEYALAKHNSDELSKLRQAAEWGMRDLQSAFPRLKATLTSDSDKRLLILRTAIHLHNFKAIYVGYNRIRTVHTGFQTGKI
jgi:hypothetical protein